MRRCLPAVIAALALVSGCAAQTIHWRWRCAPHAPLPSVQVPGEPHHRFELERVACRALGANRLGPLRFRRIVYTGMAEARGTQVRAVGYAVAFTRSGKRLGLRFRGLEQLAPDGRFLGESGQWHTAGQPGVPRLRGHYRLVFPPRRRGYIVVMSGGPG